MVSVQAVSVRAFAHRVLQVTVCTCKRGNPCWEQNQPWLFLLDIWIPMFDTEITTKKKKQKL